MVAMMFSCRVSDRGGGIPHSIVERVHNYNYSSSGSDNNIGAPQQVGLFDEITNPCNRSGENPGTMHGYVTMQCNLCRLEVKKLCEVSCSLNILFGFI